MNILDLGPGILLMHLVPLLPRKSVLQLTTLNSAFFQQFGHLRFSNRFINYSWNRFGYDATELAAWQQSLLPYVRASTLRTITHLHLNRNDSDFDNMIDDGNFTGVTSLKISNYITPEQQVDFASFARQLTEIIEIGSPERMGSDSSVAGLAAGALSKLRILHLQNVDLPPLRFILADPQGVAAFLHSITFVPFDPEMLPTRDDDEIQEIYKSYTDLLTVVSDRTLFPVLRVVELTRGRSHPETEWKKIRAALLEAMYVAAAKHGLWRISGAKKTVLGVFPLQQFLNEWACWCSRCTSDSFLTPSEIIKYGVWCEKEGRYARWDEFLADNMHIDVRPTGKKIKQLMTGRAAGLARVRGVSILPGPDLNLDVALSAISYTTRCVCIQLCGFWGVPATQILDPARFSQIEFLRVVIVKMGEEYEEPSYRHPEDMTQNLVFSLVAGLSLPMWTNLHALAVPATALQRLYFEPSRVSASCEIHLPAYDLAWVGECVHLKRFHITCWSACVKCHNEHDEFDSDPGGQGADPDAPTRGLLTGLQNHMPAILRIFVLTGLFRGDMGPKPSVETAFRSALGHRVEANFEGVVWQKR